MKFLIFIFALMVLPGCNSVTETARLPSLDPVPSGKDVAAEDQTEKVRKEIDAFLQADPDFIKLCGFREVRISLNRTNTMYAIVPVIYGGGLGIKDDPRKINFSRLDTLCNFLIAQGYKAYPSRSFDQFIGTCGTDELMGGFRERGLKIPLPLRCGSQDDNKYIK